MKDLRKVLNGSPFADKVHGEVSTLACMVQIIGIHCLSSSEHIQADAASRPASVMHPLPLFAQHLAHSMAIKKGSPSPLHTRIDNSVFKPPVQCLLQRKDCVKKQCRVGAAMMPAATCLLASDHWPAFGVTCPFFPRRSLAQLLWSCARMHSSRRHYPTWKGLHPSQTTRLPAVDSWYAS